MSGRSIPGDRIGDFEPAAAIGQELDAFAAGAGDLDDTIANQGAAAVDHGATRDLNQAAGGACEQRAPILRRCRSLALAQIAAARKA